MDIKYNLTPSKPEALQRFMFSPGEAGVWLEINGDPNELAVGLAHLIVTVPLVLEIVSKAIEMAGESAQSVEN